MRTNNRFYIGSPPDPADDDLIKCTYCPGAWTSYAWRTNNGKCSGCSKPYAGKPSED